MPNLVPAPSNTRPINILLVEDNEADILLTRRVFQRALINNVITAVRDGESALAYLQQGSSQAGASKPDIIFLDLGLPGINGEQVLSEIKKNEEFKHIPVIVLTGAEMEEAIINRFGLTEGSFMVKPVDIEKFRHVIASLGDIWFTLVKKAEQ